MKLYPITLFLILLGISYFSINSSILAETEFATNCGPPGMSDSGIFFKEVDVFTSTGIAGGTPDDPYYGHRIPALGTTSSGTLIAVSDGRVYNNADLGGNNVIDVTIRRSFDNGETWRPLQVIVDHAGVEGGGDPCIVIDRETIPDTIYVFYLYSPNSPVIGLWASGQGWDGSGTCQIRYVKSTDEGATWTSPVNLNPQVKSYDWYCALAAPGKGIQMNDGTLVVPGYYRLEDNSLNSYIFYSTDNGSSWSYSNSPRELQGGSSLEECTVVELVNGLLTLNMRSHRGLGYRAVSSTADLGETWSAIIDDAELPEPICQANLWRYKDPRLGDSENIILFSNPASSSRTNMTVKISYDDCKTWPVSKQIYSGLSAYSCMTTLANGNIGLLYEADGYGRIKFASFNMAWLLD